MAAAGAGVVSAALAASSGDWICPAGVAGGATGAAVTGSGAAVVGSAAGDWPVNGAAGAVVTLACGAGSVVDVGAGCGVGVRAGGSVETTTVDANDDGGAGGPKTAAGLAGCGAVAGKVVPTV